MSTQFDPYYKWLGIPPKDQPPNHYRLLGIELYEDDPDVIEAAANRLMAYLHEISTGDMADQAQKLLNEISTARICLLNEQRRAAYDAKLKAKTSASDKRITPLARTASSRSHPAVPRVVSADRRSGAAAQRRRSLWLMATGALLAFGAVITTLLLVLNYDRGSADVPQAEAQVPSATKPSILQLDWPVAERDGSEVFINGVAQPLGSGAILEFHVSAGVNKVTITRPGYVDFEETNLFARGDIVRISPQWTAVAETAGEASVAGVFDGVGRARELGPDEAPAGDAAATDVPVDVPPVDPDMVVTRTEVPAEPGDAPLENLPSILEVPPFSAGVRGSFSELWAVPAASDVDLRLIGGETVLGAREAFQLTSESLDDFRKAWVVHHIGRLSERTPTAYFGLSQDYLHFGWNSDCDVSQADLLRNCLLSISIDDQPAVVRLRDATGAAAIPIGGANSVGKQTLIVESLPDPALLRLAVIRAHGPDEFETEFTDQTVSVGETLPIDLGAAEDGLPLIAKLSFTAARGGARKITLEYNVRYEGAAGSMQLLERPSVQRDLRLAQQQRRQAIDARALDALDGRILFYEALDRLTRLEEGEIRLHYRIYADVGGYPVDLLVADQGSR